jgi:ABC-type Fe3+/spermidine/putrescine transport system ATPase subunit
MEVLGTGMAAANPGAADRPMVENGYSTWVAVRPENVQLFAESPERDLPNVFEVNVHDIVYVGNTTHYYLTLTNGDTLHVEQPNTGGGQLRDSIQPGKSLYAHWAPECTLVFRDQSA